jgi:hypothetical protein
MTFSQIMAARGREREEPTIRIEAAERAEPTPDTPPAEYAASTLVVRPRNPAVEVEIVAEAELLYEEVAAEGEEIVTQPLTDYVCLSDHLPDMYFARDFSYLHMYRWFTEGNAARAREWLEAAVVSQHATFHLTQELKNLYNHDRALRAAHVNKTPLPTSELPRPDTITKGGTEYKRQWSTNLPPALGVPVEVTDRLARFLRHTADADQVGYTEYYSNMPVKIRDQYFHPILYARFGRWCVEIAAWEY